MRGGTLSVDEDRIYAQVEALLGRQAEPPTLNVVETIGFMEGPEPSMATPFRRAFGFGREYIVADVYHGYTAPSQGRIVVSPKNATPAEVETLLAHEYTHWLQFRGPALINDSFGGFVDDTDSNQVRLGLVEGASVYLTDRYVESYMNVSWNQTDELRAQYEAGPPGRRLFRARYLFGAQYIHRTVDSPANLSRLYRPSSPTPVTSEQMVHGYTPSEEPERNLTVDVARGGNWTALASGRDTKGEIVVRTTLRTELNGSDATTAATGWGSDELVPFVRAGNDSRHGFAWALRWDSPEDADEFAAAFERWVAERPNDPTAFRTVRLTDETVVVLAGDPAFVGNATVSGTTGNVTVTPPGAT